MTDTSPKPKTAEELGTALNSFTGLIKYLNMLEGPGLHWSMILVFISIGVLGSVLGTRAGRQFSCSSLKKGFAGFLVVIGVYVLVTIFPRFSILRQLFRSR